MERYEKAREIAKKLCRREHLTKDEWRLLCEAISEEIEVIEAEDRRKELN